MIRSSREKKKENRGVNYQRNENKIFKASKVLDFQSKKTQWVFSIIGWKKGLMQGTLFWKDPAREQIIYKADYIQNYIQKQIIYKGPEIRMVKKFSTIWWWYSSAFIVLRESWFPAYNPSSNKRTSQDSKADPIKCAFLAPCFEKAAVGSALPNEDVNQKNRKTWNLGITDNKTNESKGNLKDDCKGKLKTILENSLESNPSMWKWRWEVVWEKCNKW